MKHRCSVVGESRQEGEESGKLGGECKQVVVEEMGTCMASCMVVAVSGKLGGECREGTCELVVGEMGTCKKAS